MEMMHGACTMLGRSKWYLVVSDATAQVDQLQQLSDRCSGHTARTFRQLSEEGQAYARWDAEQRARHLDQVQSALGAMDWCGPACVHLP